MRVIIGSAFRPAAGQTACGDVGASIPFALGTLLVLADGIGHGPEARTAAELVCQYARAHADEPLETLMRGLDRALSGSRGAAVSALAILPAARRAQFAGIGNVELHAVAATRIAPPTMPGIVGRGVRAVRVWEYPIADGDLLALVSDGISSRLDLPALAHLDPQALAADVLRSHHKAHDDGCCVIARIASSTRSP